ncbi:MAG: membrane protein insertase YidC [Spirochaetia bacterium]|nr:membrane protein insertase YidC [Spirochaetia bacterium]
MEDTKRLVTFVIISGIILFGFNYFFGPKPQAKNPGSAAATAAASPVASGTAPVTAQAAGAPQEKMIPASIKPIKEKTWTVETPLFTAAFSNQGGTLSSFKLKKYTDGTGTNQFEVEVIPGRATGTYLQLSSPEAPLSGEWTFGGIKKDGTNQTISFSRQLKPGVVVTRVYTISDDSYLIKSSFTFSNKTAVPFAIKDMVLSWGPSIHYLPDDLSKVKGVVPGYNKVVYPEGKGVKLLQIKKEKETKIQVLPSTSEWVVLKDLYFVTSFIPEKYSDVKVYSAKSEAGGYGYIRAALRDLIINPGSQEVISIDSYIGPAEYKRLKKLGMERAVDLGGIRFLGIWMLYGLDFCFKLTKNWGLAILLITLIVRGILWIPSQSSFKKMKEQQSKMALMKPRMDTLKKIYKNDPQKMNEETMKIYKEYGINPFSGCLPILLQLPIFLALYATLINTVELKGAYFIGWLKDLSHPDPYFILPVFMGVSMIVQQKMSTPPSMDPEQEKTQKIMLWGMPIILTVMSLQWPAGLLLYWGASNVLGIVQQLLVNRSKSK